MLVWASAMTFPAPIDSTASTTSICVQSACNAPNPSTSARISIPNAAIFGAVPMNRVTGVGAPSYTSGTHMWSGTAPDHVARIRRILTTLQDARASSDKLAELAPAPAPG